MLPRLHALLLVLGAGCAPSADDVCARFSVDQVRDSLDAPAHAQVVPLGLRGRPVDLVLFAPLSACVSDVLRVEPRAQDSAGGEVPIELLEEPQTVGVFGAVQARVRFTPQLPGTHLVALAFEPSLGVRQVLVDIADDGLGRPSTPVRAPDCAAPWPLDDELIACERAGVITLLDPGGERARFDGSALVVADRALWSISLAGELERRTWTGATLERTHVLPGFALRETPALHAEDEAVRVTRAGDLSRVLVRDGGVEQQGLGLGPSSGAAYFVGADGFLAAWGDSQCIAPVCTPLGDVLGVSREVLWRSTNGVLGWRWPWSAFFTPGVATFSLRYEAESVAPPRGGFERTPLWLTQPLEGELRALVSVEGRALTFTAWPQARVARVGARHVLVRDAQDAGVLHVFAR